MKKFLVSIFIFLSLFFLFGGLLLVGELTNNGSKMTSVFSTLNNNSDKPKLSMQQIDSLTAKDNYNFTSVNAAGISVYSVGK